jgi:biopolymer transport protein ExbB
MFNIIVIVLALVVSFAFYYGVMGDASGFLDAAKHEPKPGNVLATIYTGGPLVALLLSFILIGITFSIERFLSITKAQGKNKPDKFVRELSNLLAQGNLEGAVALCDGQRGSIGNVMRAGIERFKEVESDSGYSAPAKISEVQRAIDEQMNLETPLLEKNLVILSTVASISTMVGLLGTTLGMIRAFQALAESGTVSATQLSIGISEALYNTAGGLIGAVIAIIAYNFFTTKVDNFVYIIDEGILNVTEIFTNMVRK